MSAKRSYTDKDFENAIKSSISISESLVKLGLSPSGGNYCLFKQRANKLKISLEHFKGQSHGKTKPVPKRSLSEILVKNSDYRSTSYLKKRLINEGVLKEKCYRCKRTKWEGEKIPLQLDHINGERSDNRIENLTILCPNCHALTPTYCGKNIKVTPQRKTREHNQSCKTCKKTFYSSQERKYCSIECYNKKRPNMDREHLRKVKWPSREELKEKLNENTYRSVGKEYNVSDNTVRKWAKKYELI